MAGFEVAIHGRFWVATEDLPLFIRPTRRMSGFLLKFDGSPKTLVVTFQASFAGLFGSPVYA